MSILAQLLTPFIFTIHLMMVNFSAVGPLVCIWIEYRARKRNDLEIDEVGRQMAWLSINFLTYGAMFGMVLGWLVWLSGDQWFFDILLQQIPRERLVFAIGEVLFYYICMGSYCWWWYRGRREATWQRVVHRLLAILAATNLLYHFPPLFACISYIAAHYDEWQGRVVTPEVYRELMLKGEIMARTAHHWLASISIVGVMLMAKSLGFSQQEDKNHNGRWLATRGAWLALVSSILQFIVGTWFILQMTSETRKLIMGHDILGTILMLLSMVGVFALLHRLAAVALGDYQQKDVVRSIMLMMLVILLMTATLQRSRHNFKELDTSPPKRTGLQLDENEAPAELQITKKGLKKIWA